MVIALYIHGRERQRASFEPPEAALHLIFTAIGQHRLRKSQRRHRLVRAVDAPPQPANRRLQSGFVHTNLDSGMTIVVEASWLPPVGTHRTRRDVRGQAKPYEMFYAVALHNGHHRLT